MRAIPLCLICALLIAAGCKQSPPDAPDLTEGTDLAEAADLGRTQDLSAPDLSTPDLFTPDLATPPDLALPGNGVICGPMTCAVGQNCCGTIPMGGPPIVSCMAMCPAGSAITASCDGAEDCGGATPHCCGTLGIGAGTPPNCPFLSINASCKASCTTQLGFTCPMTAQVRACQRPADCATDVASPNCCEFTQGLITIKMCVSDVLKPFATRCL